MYTKFVLTDSSSTLVQTVEPRYKYENWDKSTSYDTGARWERSLESYLPKKVKRGRGLNLLRLFGDISESVLGGNKHQIYWKVVKHVFQQFYKFLPHKRIKEGSVEILEQLVIS